MHSYGYVVVVLVHITYHLRHTSTFRVGAFDGNDNFDYSGALARALDANIAVTFYFGKVDTACNYVGGLKMADTIPWTGEAEFTNAEMAPLMIAGVEAGQIKSYKGLSFLQVHVFPVFCLLTYDLY